MSSVGSPNPAREVGAPVPFQGNHVVLLHLGCHPEALDCLWISASYLSSTEAGGIVYLQGRDCRGKYCVNKSSLRPFSAACSALGTPSMGIIQPSCCLMGVRDFNKHKDSFHSPWSLHCIEVRLQQGWGWVHAWSRCASQSSFSPSGSGSDCKRRPPSALCPSSFASHQPPRH